MININGHFYKIEVTRKNISNIYLRIKDDTLLITCPRYLSDKEVIKFINDKKSWIIKNTLKKEIRLNNSKLIVNDHIYYLGRKYPLIVFSGKSRLIVKEDEIIIYCKDRTLEEALKVFYKESKNVLLKIIYDLQDKYLNIIKDYGYYLVPEYKFKVLKSAWGINYSKRNTIVINERLIHFDKLCIEAVLWHEILHFVIPNHSKRFHEVLEYHMPDYKKLIKSIY